MNCAINQAPEAEAFLNRVADLPKQPGISLDPVLAPSIEKEAELRRLFAQDRKNYHLVNLYVGLINVFDTSVDRGIRSTRTRVIKDEEDLSAKYVFPLSEDRRRKDFEPCMVDSLEEFQRNWAIFTEGSLSQLTDWNNVIAAGGSVLGCLLPLSPKDRESRRTIRKFYHSAAYPTSDIDLFLWGLNAEQAEVKINQIYEAVRDSVPWDVTCVRTKHAISIHSQYPYRSVQIVLRLYQSPAEILAGFDVDATCVAYDGSRVLANSRSIVALMRQANTVDMTRRSPSYEVRLAKYAARGFEVYVPDLRRSDVDPTIFERSLNRITGLARLLVLEKLAKPEMRISYLESRRDLRSRVKNRTIYSRRMHRKRKGDLKAEEEVAGLDMNDYDVAQMHIPYGPGWTAQRIEKLVYKADLGINSTFNPKNKDRRLHRHVAFFGTMKECVEDLCEYCPEPQNDEEEALQEEEDKVYIRGRISFIEEDPGRQSMTGSFNPIDIGEWSGLAYLGPTEKLFAAIATKDRNLVQQLLVSGTVDINRRDHVGRTALQVAVLCVAEDICLDLIDAGARMTARLADGRTALHVAAQMNLPTVVEKMLVRSTQNEEKAKAEEEAKAKSAAEKGEGNSPDSAEASDEESDRERPSSDDDWSSEEEDASKNKKAKKEDDARKDEPDADADIPEDNVDTPDVLDVNLADWDLALTPLDYAIISGSKACIQLLLNGGADPSLATKANDYNARLLHPLSLTVLISDDTRAEEIIEQLVHGGANSAQADENLFSILHRLVLSGRTRLVEKILRSDPSAVAVLNVPLLSNNNLIYPIVSAIAKGFYSVAALLLGYGAKVSITAEDGQKVENMLPNKNRNWYGRGKVPHELDYLRDLYLPVEMALAYQSYITSLLVTLGAQVSVPIKAYFERGSYTPEVRLSILDNVVRQIAGLEDELVKLEEQNTLKSATTEDPQSFAKARKAMEEKLKRFEHEKRKEGDSPTVNPTGPLLLGGEKTYGETRSSEIRRTLAYLQEMKGLLVSVSAKTYSEIFANCPDAPRAPESLKPASKDEIKETTRTGYQFISHQRWSRQYVLPQLFDQYDALFDACWQGNNARIEDLCLPRKTGKRTKPPLRITVKTQEEGYNGGAHTPLSVAILARNWDTARLILSIAKAQYKPKEETSNKSGAIYLELDNESDYESTICDSDEDTTDVGDTGARQVTDLATRGSAVQCDTSPKIFLDCSIARRVRRDGQAIIPVGPVASQACYDGDLEAFVNICDMMQQLPEPQGPDVKCLLGAIESDSPELLDEVIRRTGLGIDLGQLVASGNEKHPAPNSSKLYLGLTVHGKKRKDLARYIEGRPSDGTLSSPPLLWSAIESHSKKVIEYLAGPGPLAAYRYYAKTKSTERSEALRIFEDLDKQLPRLLGIQANHRGESSLTAVIVSAPEKEKLPLAKHILALFPAQKYVQSSIAFFGWTPLHLAAAENLEPAFFNLLLSNGLSAEQTDNRCMNIYHFVCRFGHTDLLKYFIEELPRDVSSDLVKQTTRGTEETPLMIAVLNGEYEVVEVLLQSGLAAVKECLNIRDARGSMPLHAAVHSGYARIATLLIEAAPDSDAIFSENGVGETPLETARTKFLISATRESSPEDFLRRYGSFNRAAGSFGASRASPADGHDLNSEVELLKSVQANLVRDGKLAANLKLKDALEEFVSYLAGKAKSEADFPPTPEKEQKKDRCDRETTYKVILDAVSAGSERRVLVHLTDVQRSVRASLEKANKKRETSEADEYYRRRKFLKGDEIPDEAEDEAKEKREMWNGILGKSWRLRDIATTNAPNSLFDYY